jgi:ribosome-associated protein
VARKKPEQNKEALELAIGAARIADDSNAEDILVLDLRGVSPVTDYFVIATGTSNRQMRSIADDIKVHGKKIDQKVWHIAGQDTGHWIVMDFVDVVVHLFDQEHRRYYDLELIWGESPRVDWHPDQPEDTDTQPKAGE